MKGGLPSTKGGVGSPQHRQSCFSTKTVENKVLHVTEEPSKCLV